MDILRDGLMTYMGRGNSEFMETLLREAGFTVSQLCCSRPSCFDYVARRGTTLVVIRLQPDIGIFSLNDSQELKAVSESFSAATLVVGSENREKPLQDDTVYTRHDIVTVTPKTFENAVLHSAAPLIQANPGGYYVEIDGDALKFRRQELGLSVGEMAEMVGISRRTLYGYERGMAKASVTAAYKLVWTLGIPVARPVNILEKSRAQRKYCILTTARRVFAKNKLLLRIFKRFARWRVATFKKAPFDFVISVPEEDTMIVGGVTNRNERGLDRRLDEILSVSRVVGARPIFITDGHEPAGKDIPCISREEASRIRSPEDLMVNFG
jgi:putative transcriptional regulator